MSKIVIICGPSTSGKNTIIESFFKDPKYNFKRIVTNTTRPKRVDDLEGKIYNFLSEKEFKNKIENGSLLEYESIHGYLYGTSVDSFTEEGTYLMQSDIRGAINIKKHFPQTLIIFINLPEKQIIARLHKRGETSENIKIRLQTAKNEIKMKDQADIIITNLDGKLNESILNIKKTIDKFLQIS